MDCKVLSLLRPSPRLFRPWSVIFSHLLTSQQTSLIKVTYQTKLKLMDSKELSLLRPPPRVFRPPLSKPSLIFSLETNDFLFYPFPHWTFTLRLILPSGFPQPSLFLKIHFSTIETSDMSRILMV